MSFTGSAALFQVLFVPAPMASSALSMTVFSCASAATSFCSGHETLAAINNGYAPKHSDDKSHGAYGNWPRTGTQWVQYDWSQPITTRAMDVYWFDDRGGVRLPKAVLERYEQRLARALASIINVLDPDVIVLDIAMPGLDGLEAARRLKARGCRSRLVFLTVWADADYVREQSDLPFLVRDYELLKWVGANSYRTSHYPYAEEAMALADRLDVHTPVELRQAAQSTLEPYVFAPAA